jgi:hypothetical protein
MLWLYLMFTEIKEAQQKVIEIKAISITGLNVFQLITVEFVTEFVL